MSQSVAAESIAGMIGLTLRCKPSAMGVAPHGKNLAHRKCEIDLRILGNECNPTGNFFSRAAVDRFAIQHRFALIGPPQSREQSQERAFTAAVRADQRGHFTGTYFNRSRPTGSSVLRA